MKIRPLIRIGLIAASLYYGGKREMPPALQGAAVMTTLVGLLEAFDELIS